VIKTNDRLCSSRSVPCNWSSYCRQTCSTKGGTEQEAKGIKDALKDSGFFLDRGSLVLLSKGQGGTVVSFVVREGSWNEPDIDATFQQIGRDLAPAVGGLPIKVHLLNLSLESKKEIPIT
jgi:hypothetical protein